jgi:hypothetical protein
VDFLRFVLVLACMAPLFLLMAIRGVGVVPWEFYFPIFIGLAIFPNIYLVVRIAVAIRRNDRKLIRVGGVTDNREQLITYVFATLLPLFQSSASTDQDLYASLCALLLIIFVFGHMELYYMNFFFALAGYRVISLKPSARQSSAQVDHVLITKRRQLPEGTDMQPVRVTDFLLFDK